MPANPLSLLSPAPFVQSVRAVRGAQALPALPSAVRGLSPQPSCGYSGLLSDLPVFPGPCFSLSAESSWVGEGQPVT